MRTDSCHVTLQATPQIVVQPLKWPKFLFSTTVGSMHAFFHILPLTALHAFQNVMHILPQTLQGSSCLTMSVCVLQVAAALRAEKLILMTDVPGVLKDKDDIKTKYAALDIRSTRQLVADGIIAGGMIPK